MKLFKTGSIDVVTDCQSYFAIDLPSCVLKRRQDKFVLRYISTVNGFVNFATSCNAQLSLANKDEYIIYYIYTPVQSVNYCVYR